MPSYKITARYSDGGYWGDTLTADTRTEAEAEAVRIMEENGELYRDRIEVVDCIEVDEAAERVRDMGPALLAALKAVLPYVPGCTNGDTAGRPWLAQAIAAVDAAEPQAGGPTDTDAVAAAMQAEGYSAAQASDDTTA